MPYGVEERDLVDHQLMSSFVSLCFSKLHTRVYRIPVSGLDDTATRSFPKELLQEIL